MEAKDIETISLCRELRAQILKHRDEIPFGIRILIMELARRLEKIEEEQKGATP